MNRIVNKYYLKDWEEPLKGLFLAEDREWILIKYIPVDYVLDGYSIIKKSTVSKIERSIEEEKIELVMELRGVSTNLPENFKFGTTVELLNFIEGAYGLFEFKDSEEGALFIGKKNKIVENDYLIIDYIDANGKVEENYDYEFKIEDIRIINFDSDYFNAIKLLWKDNLKENKITLPNNG